MAIINAATRVEGNRGANACANIVAHSGYLSTGTQVQVNIEFFAPDGASLGIQGLDYTVTGTEDYFDPDVGGVPLKDHMEAFANAITAGWNPQIEAWAVENVPGQVQFHAKPVTDEVELLRIRDWIYVPV